MRGQLRNKVSLHNTRHNEADPLVKRCCASHALQGREGEGRERGMGGRDREGRGGEGRGKGYLVPSPFPSPPLPSSPILRLS